MGREHIGHSDIVRFSDERVNLKREDAKEAREQVWRLRDKLEGYLKEHPDFELRKILLSGSLAKGTALKSLNDIDVACYVAADKAPASIGELIGWLARRLRTAFPNLKPEQVKPNQFSVTISFVGTGLRVDVVPILYADDPDWTGRDTSWPRTRARSCSRAFPCTWTSFGGARRPTRPISRRSSAC